jgi:hypothetical protein
LSREEAVVEEQEAVGRFWAAFNHYEHGRCWFGDVEDEGGDEAMEAASGAVLEWDIRGPARFEAERVRALRLGGSRLAAKTPPPYGDAGVCGRGAYTLQLLAGLYGLADQVEEAARDHGWELNVGVLAYREPSEEDEEDDTETPTDDLITDLDAEELAACDTLVFWIEVEATASAEAAWWLGDGLGRLMAGAAGWFERLDAGDREALRSLPRLQA